MMVEEPASLPLSAVLEVVATRRRRRIRRVRRAAPVVARLTIGIASAVDPVAEGGDAEVPASDVVVSRPEWPTLSGRDRGDGPLGRRSAADRRQRAPGRGVERDVHVLHVVLDG
jgi:hypothetical protein